MRVVWLVAFALIGCGRLGFDAVAQNGSAGADAAGDGKAIVDGPPGDVPAALVLSGIVFHCDMDADPAATTSLVCEPPAYSGPCVGACPALAAGHIGNALALDGATDQATLPSSLFTTNAAYSVAVWVMPTPGAGNGTVLAKPFSTASDIELFSLIVDAVGGVLWGTTATGTSQDYNADQTQNLRDGAWHHIAVVWTGSSKVLYIDGMLKVSAPATVLGGMQPLQFGVDLHSNAPLWRYSGRIDELQVYSRALSLAEVGMLAGQ